MKKEPEQYNSNKKGRGSTATKIIATILCICGVGLLGYFLWSEYNRPPEVVYEPPSTQATPPTTEPPPELVPTPEEAVYPVGKLISTKEREAYVDSDLMLYIPRLDWQGPVLNGVDNDTLKDGVGLFDYAQLPGGIEKNSNVSIAGHRDIHGMEFYYIDTVAPGDPVYLTYQGDLYTYIVEENFITDAYDWDPIRVKDYACVTLQSCTPIGVATERIFVVGRLVEITPGAGFPDGAATTTVATEAVAPEPASEPTGPTA